MAMAGCGSYSKIEGFAFLPVTCFTMALTTFVSQNLGANSMTGRKGSKIWSFLLDYYCRVYRYYHICGSTGTDHSV